MPPTKPVRQPKTKKPKQFFSKSQEIAAPRVQELYELEKTSALAAHLVPSPELAKKNMKLLLIAFGFAFITRIMLILEHHYRPYIYG